MIAGRQMAAEPADLGAVVFFNEETWRGFFNEFPLQDESMRLAFPAEADAIPDRAPVVLPGRRGARD